MSVKLSGGRSGICPPLSPPESSTGFISSVQNVVFVACKFSHSHTPHCRTNPCILPLNLDPLGRAAALIPVTRTAAELQSYHHVGGA
jgi:hypothetical protein